MLLGQGIESFRIFGARDWLTTQRGKGHPENDAIQEPQGWCGGPQINFKRSRERERVDEPSLVRP